jgi:hypothetical protein
MLNFKKLSSRLLVAVTTRITLSNYAFGFSLFEVSKKTVQAKKE